MPNLKEMHEQQARLLLDELSSALSAEKEYAIRHEDNAMEMPQSGERIRGPGNMRAFQEGFASNSNLPSTGPGDTLSIFVAVSVLAYFTHRRFLAN